MQRPHYPEDGGGGAEDEEPKCRVRKMHRKKDSRERGPTSEAKHESSGATSEAVQAEQEFLVHRFRYPENITAEPGISQDKYAGSLCLKKR